MDLDARGVFAYNLISNRAWLLRVSEFDDITNSYVAGFDVLLV